MILRHRDADGKLVMRRPAFRPETYAVPADTLDGLRSIPRAQSFSDAVGGHDGMLRGYAQVDKFERDGHTWYLFQANGSEHCVEIEVIHDRVTQVLPVAPERAWAIALERDRALRPGVIYE